MYFKLQSTFKAIIDIEKLVSGWQTDSGSMVPGSVQERPCAGFHAIPDSGSEYSSVLATSPGRDPAPVTENSVYLALQELETMQEK